MKEKANDEDTRGSSNRERYLKILRNTKKKYSRSSWTRRISSISCEWSQH